MHHTVVYRGSVGAGAANVSLPLIIGAGDVNSNNQYFPPQDMDLLYALTFGTNIVTPRITTPSLREFSPHYVRPFNIATPIGSNAAIDNLGKWTLRLKARESIDVQVTSVDAGSQTGNAILGLMVRRIPTPKGDRRRILCTGTTTLTANVWSNVTLTFADVLPAGRFAIVGMQAFGATMYAARLRLPDSPWAPGIPTVQTIGQRPPDQMIQEDWGVFGYFDQSAVPTLECLATAGDTAQTLLLDVVRI